MTEMEIAPIEIEARREALRLAAQHGGDARMIVDRAQAYIDFIFGSRASEALTPEQEARTREIVDEMRPLPTLKGAIVSEHFLQPCAKTPPHDGGSLEP